MATWIAFALGCATTALLFLTYFTFDTAADVPQPSLPPPGSRFGGGFGYPLYNKGVIQVANVTFEGHSLPFAVEAPQLGSAVGPIEGRLHVLGAQSEPRENDEEAADASQACNVPQVDLTGSIALVASGGCSLVAKVLNCEAVGARAVVIESDAVRGVDVTFETVQIPGLSMSPPSFKTLAGAAGEDAALWALPHGLDFSTTDVLILLVVRPVMLFLIVSVILAVNLGCAESRRTAPQRVVSALPTRIWMCPGDATAASGLWNQEGCRICLEDFADGCEIMTLPCGHEFHSSCVSSWLLKQREVCPLCKMGVDRERIPLLV